MSNQLEVIVKESGLETSKAKYILENFKDFFAIAEEWEVKAKTIKVTNANQIAEMEMARVGRLFLREKRRTIEKSRKQLKEQSLREGKAIDGIANVLKSLIVPLEEYLSEQENFVSNQIKKRAEELRLAEEKKAEEERIERERLEKLGRDRMVKALPYKAFWPMPEYQWSEMTDNAYDSLMEFLVAESDRQAKEQEKIRKENERLQAEAAKKEAEQKRKDKAAQEEKEAFMLAAQQEREKEAAEEKRKRDEIEAKAEAERQKLLKQARDLKEKAQQKIEEQRKQKNDLAKKLKKQIECPHCHKKFRLEDQDGY